MAQKFDGSLYLNFVCKFIVMCSLMMILCWRDVTEFM